ncbi:MAG: DUF4214 domain-containing protein [Nitrospirota bacterium]
MRIQVVTISGGLDTCIGLYPPGGGPAETGTCDWCPLGSGDVVDHQLQQTGLYTIMIIDDCLANPGTYNISLTKIPSTLRPGIYNPSPQNGVIFCNSITSLSWDPVAGTIGYDAFFGEDIIVPLVQICDYETSPSCPIPAMTPGEAYYWHVVAHTITGDIKGPYWWFYVPDIGSLVTHYYNKILDRAPDQGGFDYWVAEIQRLICLGIDIKEGFIAIAKTFFNSTEYLAKGKTNDQYVTDLYETFFDRMPSQSEIDFWIGYITGGASRNIVLNFFVFSAEYKTYMEEQFGVDITRPENNLVNDFYRGILSRLPDNGGFNYWLNKMRVAQCTGSQAVKDVSYQIASLFVHSQEYISKNRNNAQYLEDLYDAVMRRSASPAEVNYWLNQLTQIIHKFC